MAKIRVTRKNRKFDLHCKVYDYHNMRCIEEKIYDGNFGIHILEGSIDEIIEKLQEIKTQCESKGYTDINISIDDGNDMDARSRLYGWRKETIEEARKRVTKEEEEEDLNRSE